MSLRVLIAVLAGLLLVALGGAEETATALEVQNPGFEQEKQGWEETGEATFAGTLETQTQLKHGGLAALHIASEEPGDFPWVRQRVDQLKPGATYALGVWYRGVPAAPTTAAVKIEFLDAKNQTVGQSLGRVAIKGDQWQELSTQGVAPPGATGAWLMLRMYGEGELWLDDVTLKLVKAPPALWPQPARLGAAPGHEITLSVSVLGQAAAAGRHPVVVLAGNKPVQTTEAEFVAEGTQFSATVKLTALPAGDYTLRATFAAGTADWPLHVTVDRRQPVGLNSNGLLLHDGRMVVPLGLYHVAAADYALLSQRGFTAAQGPGSHDLKIVTPVVQEAAAQRLGLVMPLYAGGQVAQNMTYTGQKVRALAREPAVLAWKLADEPDLHPEIAGEVPDAYRKLRAMDRSRPIVLTVASAADVALWGQFCDILELAVFPLPDRPLSLVGEEISRARQQLQPWQGLFALLQAGWQPVPGNQPTLEQARAMAYLALIKGATGVFWYSFRDPGWSLTQTPLWEKFKGLNEEIARLGALLATNTLVKLGGEPGALVMRGWEQQGQVIVAVVNAESTAQSGVFRLDKAVAKAEVVGGEAQVEVRDGGVSVSFARTGAALISVSDKP